MVFDGRIVMTPTFMGAEPRRVGLGPLRRDLPVRPGGALGLDLIRSFDGAQRERAIIHPSIHPDDIPPSLQNLFDGRMQAGAFHDNLVAPYQGVAGADMTDAQRRVLLALTGHLRRVERRRHAKVQRAEVEAHLDETWFSWYGGYDDVAPFYYRVHSPVILIEFDHHPGVAFDNVVPTPPPRAHRRAHTQRWRLRRRPPPPAPRAVRPQCRAPPVRVTERRRTPVIYPAEGTSRTRLA